MLITFHCAECQTKLEIAADAAGNDVECPKCGTTLTVPRKGVGPGSTVGGFRIEQLLGKGGMGEVYLARQLSMDRNVALKILSVHLTAQKEEVDRFMQEVHTAALLEHPNIVTAFEAGEDGGIYYLAMAYVKGQPLSDLLTGGSVLAERDALGITRKIAQALAYSWNKHRLLHRDIKPSNIMVDEEGDPKLTDMGIAKSLNAATGMTTTGTVMGTPNYMSPEQAEDAAELDFRSDMYSLGATLYHMLTGNTPFEGSSMMDTFRKQATEPLPDPRAVNPEITDGCMQVLQIMLAGEPAQRHRSWEELVADIDRVLAGRHCTAPLPARGDASIRCGSVAKEATHGPRKVVLGHSTVKRIHGKMSVAQRQGKKKTPPKSGSLVPGIVAVLIVAAVAAAAVQIWPHKQRERSGRPRPSRVRPVQLSRGHAVRPRHGVTPPKERTVLPPREHTVRPPERVSVRPRPRPSPHRSGEWIDLFNGKNTAGWKMAGKKSYVEDGAIVCPEDADLFYPAAWTEFTIDCEFTVTGRGDHALGLMLAHAELGRGSTHRVLLVFQRDGDLHVVRGGDESYAKLWRSGGGKFPPGKWVRLKVELTREKLAVYKDDKLLGSADVSGIPACSGGICFFSGRRYVTRIRNVRVRVPPREG